MALFSEVRNAIGEMALRERALGGSSCLNCDDGGLRPHA